MSIERGGTLQIGSLGAAPAPLPLSLVAAAVPGAADVTVSDGQGRLLGQFRLPGMQIASLSVSNAVAEPGLNRLTVTYTPLAADANARLLVQDVVLPRP
jgi:hypothetical protein